MFKTIRTLGITSDVAYTLGFLSGIGSVFIWYSQGGTKEGADKAAGERFGIFVGLWAPTFFAIGNGIAVLKDGE
ncbi:MAG: hypothetical protein DWI69_13570 [Chloroflexi bacterium]|nr:MAG: hypothetical protein DWI69_13570 [Chloroflexota bacterium]